MTKESDIADMTAEGRKCLLSASSIRLSKLKGLADAMADLAECPRSKSHVQLREACRLVAQRLDLPGGPVRIEAVVERRRTVGHRVTDVDSLVRIAHGVVLGRTMEAVLRGPLVPKIARAAGLRDARRRPWSKDSAKAAVYEGLADRFLQAWAPMLLEGRPDDGWLIALVIPGAHGLLAIVVTDAETRNTQVLFLTREQCPFEGDDRGETVRAGVSHALRNSQTHRSEPTRVWTPIERGDEVYVAALEMGMEIPDDINFRTRLQICWTRTVSSALARFRRMLPRVVSEHASLCGYAFSDARSAAGFLVLRGEWSLRDYERMNQAIRLVPILRDYLGAPEVTGPVRTGRPIEEAIRGVVAHVENALPEPMQPLHPKTVKSLGATWPLTLRRAAVRVRDVELIRVLERLHRRDTHLRPFRTSEMMQIARIMLIGSMETDHVVDAIMAHRDVKGRVQEVKDLRDAYNWIHGRLRTVLFTGPGIAEDELWVRAVGAAYRILFPESRRHGGLAEVVADWHTRQARLDAGFRNLFQTMVAAHLQDRAVDVSEILFPHFLAGETTIDGVTMRPLVEEDDIVREGEEMDHCVGSYVGGAQAGRSLLISQVSDAGRSTVEVRLEADDRGEPALVVQQNRAPRNEEPPAAHVRAISKLLALFPEGVRRDLAERIRRASAMAENDLERNYALLTPDELARLKEHALADLRYFMPRALRRPTVPEWVSHLERMEDEDDARRAAEAMGAEPLVALAS